ncbi:MAG: imidazolonepropionase [Defluviitaleaceae bacterium]|nr:imidazolonepropionase [Defluviitaleaceae bacterium]
MSEYQIINIGLLATPQGSSALSGEPQGKIRLIKNAAIGVKNGKITYVGEMEDAARASNVIDAAGRLVTPGLVDAHTHLVFGGFRQHELGLKLAGASYLEILQSGGGILSTVEATRAASYDELYTKGAAFLDEMLNHGTTTVEIKSGYGLDLETELKQLRVINDLAKSYNVVPTFLGAHAVPTDFSKSPDSFVDLVVNEMLPVVASQKLAKYCDIFCEKSVFNIGQSRRVLKAAKALGLGVKIHADEIVSMGGAGLAAELGAVSADHLLESGDEDLAAMAQAGTIAVLLPATSFYLNKGYARARDMINKNVPVAVASDFNPGSSPSYNMQFVLNLACLKLRLTPAEALTAATLNAAAAIGLADTKGSLEVGKDADIAVWDCPDLNFLFYRYGNNQAYKIFAQGDDSQRSTPLN